VFHSPEITPSSFVLTVTFSVGLCLSDSKLLEWAPAWEKCFQVTFAQEFAHALPHSILSQILAHYIATTSNQRHRAVVHIAFFTYFMQGVRNMLLYLLAKDDITHHRDFRDLLN